MDGKWCWVLDDNLVLGLEFEACNWDVGEHQEMTAIVCDGDCASALWPRYETNPGRSEQHICLLFNQTDLFKETGKQQKTSFCYRPTLELVYMDESKMARLKQLIW